MARYILRRLLLMMIVLLGMSVITFALTHIVPGNPARLLAGQHATQEQVEAVAKLYGLDRPVVEQYWVYIGGLFRGDLGMSLTTRRPVADDLRQYLPATIELTTAAMLLVIGLTQVPLPAALPSAAAARSTI
jgi:peptide/nickel transport system permease protein